jgi:hypothetical protein
MGEMPVPAGAFLEIVARIKVLRGPLPEARIAAWPGGAHGRPVAGVPTAAPAMRVPAHEAVVALGAVIGPEPLAGVDLVWDARVLYAHVGLDLIGLRGAVVRIESLAVREVTDRFGQHRVLPGFGPARLRR